MKIEIAGAGYCDLFNACQCAVEGALLPDDLSHKPLKLKTNMNKTKANMIAANRMAELLNDVNFKACTRGLIGQD
jgi:hypothetical protein